MIRGTHLQQVGTMTDFLAQQLRKAGDTAESVTAKVTADGPQFAMHRSGETPSIASLGNHAFLVRRARGDEAPAAMVWHGLTPGSDAGAGIFNLHSSGTLQA